MESRGRDERPARPADDHSPAPGPDAATSLTEKERVIHDQGLVSVLKQLHDDLDEAVFHAYGWDDLWKRRESDDPDAWENELLERLVALNLERAEEEARGHIRWLRPEFQNPDGDTALEAKQTELKLPAAKKKAAKKVAKQKWPDRLPDQVAAVRALIPEMGADAAVLSSAFGRKSGKREGQIAGVLEVLTSLGRV